MNLKVLLPFQVFAEIAGVTRIVAESIQGSFGLLPHRLDCAAALVPGILTYETPAHGTVYLAVDHGVLVKTGADVLVSVRRAIAGTNLSALHEAVKQQFSVLDTQQRAVRAAVAKMDGSLIGPQTARACRGAADGLVWARHVRTHRLVGRGADGAGRGTRPVVGPPPPGAAFLDPRLAHRGFGARLRQCLALGVAREPGHGPRR